MATVTTFPRNINGRSPDNDESIWESPLIAVGDTWEPSNFPNRRKHWEAGVIFCNSSGVQVAATGGTVAVLVKPWATMFYEAPATGASITATAPVLSTWACSTYGVKFTPAAVLTATHYKVRLSVARN